MTLVERLELQMAVNAVNLLIAYDAATRIKLEWSEGQTPEIRYTSRAALEYISVSFTVHDKIQCDETPKNGGISHWKVFTEPDNDSQADSIL